MAMDGLSSLGTSRIQRQFVHLGAPQPLEGLFVFKGALFPNPESGGCLVFF